MIQMITEVLFCIMYAYVAASTLYLLVMAAAGRWGKGMYYPFSAVKSRIAVIIPAYKEDKIILETVEKAYRHHYPKHLFSIMVVADSLHEETLDRLRRMPVQVKVVHFDVSTKAKSIKAALQALPDHSFDIAFILDADNVMGSDCLEKVNGAFQKGCKAIQCQRIAKNTHTAVALLDAISESINNNLFRKGPAVAGLSAAPAGSGMAFDFEMLKNIFLLDHLQYSAAEDREIDIELMKRKVHMEFIADAYVFDEKVADTGAFEKQRIRWLEAQLNHALRFFQPDMRKIPRTILYYNRFFQSLLLPRLLYLMVTAIISMLLMAQWLTGVTILFPSSAWWLLWIAAYAATLLISIPKRFYTLQTLKAVLTIPVLILAMLKALLQVKKNRKEFLHTHKTYTTDKGIPPS